MIESELEVRGGTLPTQARPGPNIVPLSLRPIDPFTCPPDEALMASLDPVDALSNGLLPWRRAGAAVVVLSAVPSRAVVHLARLKAAFGTDVRIARAEPVALEKALLRFAARPLVLRAEARCPGPASCRSLPWNKLCRWFTCGFLALAAVSFATPILIFACLAGIGGFVLLAMAGLRLAAVVALLRRDTRDDGAAVMPARPPMISLLVPLYRESEIAGTLLARMAELDYPRDRLELCLIVEDDDLQTRRTLEMSDLPEWARIIEVPEGSLRTKPRALNYAMAFAQGSIIGVYDAEDSPAPDHLRRVAEVFARREPTTACLQGALDYFNCDRTWVARCFTLEYASWFRVLLPGIERLGLALPLGGTTLFLRREALEAVGGWDAHNVTEDADLGIRLARQGYRTEIIPVSTVEEATTRIWPWIRQRSRWLKGYAVTWAVHMRDPRALWRDLGPRRFLGFQLMFAGTLLQFALAPVLWSFWLVPLGLPHPLAQVLSPALLVALSILFLASQILDLAFAVLGTHRAGKANLSIWAPVLIPYFIMATVALYRAAWQLVWQPFQWDKTAHGLDRPPVTLAPAARLPIIVRTGAWRRRAGGES